MESIWKKSTKITERPCLKHSVTTEAAVIGGGLAGILIAYFLQKAGIQTVVLEANRIGSGQTENTTAKITSQHGLIYEKLIKQAGEDYAGLYAEAGRQALNHYQKLISELNIDCNFSKCPSYLFSQSDNSFLTREFEACRLLDMDVSLTKDTSLPVPVSCALKLEEQAEFHPLKFLNALAENLTIYEHSKVIQINDRLLSERSEKHIQKNFPSTSSEKSILFTDKGSVTANYIIFASHFPFLNSPGYYFMRMHQERSYLIALEHAAHLDGMYLEIDQKGNSGYSLRNAGNYLLFGGEGHRCGENSSGGCYERLRQAALKFFPSSKEVSHWSAQDCMTLDGIPYIGRFSSSTPDWYVATGFQKWGMTSSMTAASIICGYLTGHEPDFSKVFTPQRFHLSASASAMITDGMKTAKALSRDIFYIPKEHLEKFAPGEGGIINYHDEKAGVYRSPDGTVYAVSTRCPHLGCQLEWNPDELSWDCPCHGSRFDYTGKLLNNPALEPLTPI